VKTLCVLLLLAGGLALAQPATGDPIGPPPDTSGTGAWVASCVHPYHPFSSCGWIAAPGRYAYCLDYPGGVTLQLTCYSPVSGWVVNIPGSVPPIPLDKRPRARRDPTLVSHTVKAFELKLGLPWYDDRPISATFVCQAAKRFFRCDSNAGGNGYGVWFKPNGTFVVYLHRYDAKTLPPTGTTVLIYGSR
jgi:hypothetical protein